MFRLIALSTLMVNPLAYYTMKNAALLRHQLYNKYVEGGDGRLKDTWHEDVIKWVYPL